MRIAPKAHSAPGSDAGFFIEPCIPQLLYNDAMLVEYDCGMYVHGNKRDPHPESYWGTRIGVPSRCKAAWCLAGGGGGQWGEEELFDVADAGSLASWTATWDLEAGLEVWVRVKHFM